MILLFFTLLLSGCSGNKCIYNSSYLKVQRENGTLSKHGEDQRSGGRTGVCHGDLWMDQTIGSVLGRSHKEPRSGLPPTFLMSQGLHTAVTSNNRPQI